MELSPMNSQRIDVEPSVAVAVPHPSSRLDWRQWSPKAFGLFLVLLVVFLWVISGGLIQYVYDDLSFDRPFLLTYYSTSLFTLYLILRPLLLTWNRSRIPYRTIADTEDGDGSAERKAQCYSLISSTIKPAIKLALILCPLWFILNYTYNYGLSITSVASSTILSSTSGLWTLILSTIFLNDRIKLLHILGVLFTIGGASLVAVFDDDRKKTHSFVGDVWCLVSAVFYGIYTVTLKTLTASKYANVDMQLLFGFIGLLNVLMFWPFFFILDATNVETATFPSGQVIGFLTLNGIFGTVISDYLWAQAVLLTSPFLATIGLTLTIPLAMVFDWIFHSAGFNGFYFLGSAFVVCGFLLVSRSDATNESTDRPRNDASPLDTRESSVNGPLQSDPPLLTDSSTTSNLLG